jgi:hypothetical protein
MQSGMTNVSGIARLRLRRSTRRSAALLQLRGGRGQLSVQHAVGSLSGVAPSKCGIRSGSAGVLGSMLQHEQLLVQVLNFELHAALAAP